MFWRQPGPAPRDDRHVGLFKIAGKSLGVEQRRRPTPHDPRLEAGKRFAVGRVAKRKSVIVGKRRGDEIAEPRGCQNAGRYARGKSITRQADQRHAGPQCVARRRMRPIGKTSERATRMSKTRRMLVVWSERRENQALSRY